MFFYSDTSVRNPIDPGLLQRMDPNNAHLKHLENWFFLKFVMTNSDSWIEKSQATKEIEICERKLKYWERNPKFDQKRLTEATETLKEKWNMK